MSELEVVRIGLLGAVTNVRLYATRHRSPQLKLFALEEALGDTGWLKALALDGYAPRSRSKPEMLQEALFSYLEAKLKGFASMPR